MRCLAACQTELAIRMLDEILLPSFEVEFLVESKPLARRLHDSGLNVVFADLKRTDTYLKADLTPGTCVVVEDNGRKSLRKLLEAIWDAGGTLVYVLGVGTSHTRKREEELKAQFPELNYLALSELFGGPLLTEFSRSLTRLKVQQYQRFFSDADRVLILLHNDPDPDALASGLALRNVLRRNRQTAVIAAFEGVTRPENQRMMNLLDIQIEIMTAAHVNDFDRIAMVDVQPHYFGGEIDRVDLVIDHHPEQSGYTAVYKDIRVDYGSTSTILTEHLRAVDANFSERTATAMLYAIKSDTLFFNRQANRVDIEAFSYLYPLADATLIRKMEGAEITMDRLDYVLKARQNGRMTEQVFCAFLGTTPREDFIPYVADFYLQLENVQWTIISGIVNDTLVMSVRNLGYSRNAGEFVRKYFQRNRQRRWPSRDGQGSSAIAKLQGEIR
jgi:nanoRNase/pAp phosphatase (c-di-AMP/oligoRNAs hydrolase)